MDKFDRILELHKLLSNRRTPISRREIETRLECSATTAKRAIELLRDHLGAPLVYERARNGYFYDPGEEALYELPGLWFNDSELFALIASHRLLAEVRPGLLEDHIEPLRTRIESLLRHRRLGAGELEKRIRILQMAARPTDLENFRQIATALARRKRLRVFYHSRSRDQTTERDLSPQRLVYYRDNWYLDAWCHLRKGLRSFAVDRLQPRLLLAQGAKRVADATLHAELAGSYGIFAGKPTATAVLRFSSARARWVADEQWHSQQRSEVLPDGGLRLEVPYDRPEELIMDILKYGADVEVLAPLALRRAVAARLREAAERYGSGA